MQTIGCAAQRFLITADGTQSQNPKDALQRLKKGMQAKIKIREETDVPFQERVFECVIWEVGSETLTVIKTRYTHSGKKFTFQHADILNINYVAPVLPKKEISANAKTLMIIGGVIVSLTLILYIYLINAELPVE